MPGSDFARLPQSSNAGSSAVDAVASCDLQTSAGLRRIILLFDNRPCAAVGYNSESDETISISEPVVFLDASDSVHPALCNQLLKQVKLRAAEQGAQRLHFLQQNAEGASRFAALLPAHGFVPATEILRWELTVRECFERLSPGQGLNTRISSRSSGVRQSRAASDADRDMIPNKLHDQCEFREYDFAAADVCADGELQRSLTQILACSEDFISQPLPTATTLLSRWRQMSASVWLCRVDHRIAGLITIGTHPTAPADVVAAATESDSCICVEYVGVVPEFRRRQIASLMIHRIPTLVNLNGTIPVSRSASHAFRISAYSDAANYPAGCLYQQCGFTQSGRMNLWCCDLNEALRQTDI